MSVETPWPICGHCKNIPLSFFCQLVSAEPFEQRRKYNLQASFAALRYSASRGCHSCTLFYEAVREPYKNALHTAPVFFESLFERTSAFARTIAITVDLNRVVRSGDGAESHLKSPEYQCLYGRFEFPPIGEMRWTMEETKIPWYAKHTQSSLRVISRKFDLLY